MLTCGLLRTNFSFDTAVSLGYVAEPSARIELATPSLPRKCTATVLRGLDGWVLYPYLTSGGEWRTERASPVDANPVPCGAGVASRLEPCSLWGGRRQSTRTLFPVERAKGLE